MVAALHGERALIEPSHGWRVVAFLVAATVVKLLASPFAGSTADIHQQLRQAEAFVAGLDVLDPANTGGNPSFFPVGHYVIAAAALLAAGATATPFAIWIKTPAVVADLAIALVLRRQARVGDVGATLYMLSPVSLLLSVHHGQLHTVATALGVGAVALAERARPVVAALVLGLAVTVRQHFAVLLVPLARRFGSNAAWPLLAFAGVVVVVNLPLLQSTRVHRALTPTWTPGVWGYAVILQQGPRVLELVGVQVGAALATLNALLATRGSIIYLVWAVVFAVWVWRRPAVDRWRAALLFFTGFYAVSPGFGVQWFVWALPFWIVVSLRGATVYSMLAGTFAGLLYWVWTFNAKYGVTSITADLGVLNAGDRALYILTGVVGLVTWGYCVRTAWRLFRCP